MLTHLLESLQLVRVLQQRDHTQVDHASNCDAVTAAADTMPYDVTETKHWFVCDRRNMTDVQGGVMQRNPVLEPGSLYDA